MKIKLLRFPVACLTLGLIAVLFLGTAACSSKPATTATLSSISIAPVSPSNLPVGSVQAFLASGTYSDGRSGVDISSQVTWTSSDPTAATVSATGTATGVAIGSTKITASLDDITSQAVILTVITATPTATSTTITPAVTTTTTGVTIGTTTTTTTNTATTTSP
jgi:trimeric autotransporter adhesin